MLASKPEPVPPNRDSTDPDPEARRFFRSPLRLGCLLFAAVIVSTAAWSVIQHTREQRAVESLRAAGVDVAMSSRWFLFIRRSEYPSAVLFGRHDAEKIDWTPLRRIRHLNQVQLEGTEHVDRVLTELARIPSLRNLFLDDSDVTAAGLRALSQNHAPLSLSLAGTTLHQDAFEALADFPRLALLNLSRARFDPGWLAPLHHQPSLQVLDLRETDVSDDDLETLAGFTGADLLILDDTRVTGAGVRTLRNRLRGVRVHWEGGE